MAKFFLGANSEKGFYSLYDGFCADKGDYLHLIKAGPGCGKSGFMRRIGEKAEELGFDVEYILCSGDPDSLDGVYFPKLKVGYVDATAPHALEPRHFGADSDYVNLGQFCSSPPLEDVKKYMTKYKLYYKRAYSLLRGAGELKNADYPEFIGNTELLRITQRARNAVNRSLGKAVGSGLVKKRFIHCISCLGEVVLTDAVEVLCKQVYLLDNRFGLAKHYLQAVVDEAAKRKDDIIICPSPLIPKVPEAVIFPAQQVGFISSDIYSTDIPYRHVRLDALVPSDKYKSYKAEIKKTEKIYGCIIESACSNLAEAKRWHDELENVYKPYIDFAALDEFTKEEIKKLFA